MKILQIAHCFPPESMTGAEIYAYNLARELSKDNQISVFYRINNPREKEYRVIKDEYNGLTVYKINNTLKGYNSLRKIYKNKGMEEAFVRILDEVRPDVAHIHHLLFLSLGIIDEIKKRNIPVIFTLHDYWLVCPRGQLLKANLKLCNDPSHANCLCCLAIGLNPKNLFKRLFKLPAKGSFSKRFDAGLKDVYKKVDLFIAPSNFLLNRFIEFGIPSEKIIYSDNGMNLDLFKDIEKTKSDKIRFGFIGTLIPSKGAHILIKAFNRIKSDKAILKIYGKSPVNNGVFDYYHAIKRTARHNKNIRFMGTFDNRDIAKIFKEIDVLVFPSLWQENSPLVLHEALLTRTPVIASDSGGISELIENNRDGYLFKPGDAEKLFYHIMRIIRNPEEIYNLKGGFKNVKGIKSNALELEDIYHKIKCQSHY